uniref:Tubulin tyrosine ligase like 6 n=1 Tax=Molossus molossus TaxID=27622 RepID=A0A7J8D3P5_MOLMO|nr:tubulin tyrosine ligase like 6 [Molossus molossus]
MLQHQPLEGKEETESEEREDSSAAELKEIVTLALVRENTAEKNGLQDGQQQGKTKRKKKRMK